MFPDISARRAPRVRPLVLMPPEGNSPDRVRQLLRGLLQVRFIRFLLVAGVNTLFGYSFFAVLILIGVHYPIAAAIATVAGVLFNFQTTARLVFESRDGSLVFRFVAVYGVGYVVSVALLRLGVQLGVPVLLTAAVLAVPMGFFTYTLQRLLVFGGAK